MINLTFQSSSLNNWQYETKCARCGSIHVRLVTRGNNALYSNFEYAINEALKDPLQFNCDACEKLTIQNIVSYELP